MALRFFSTRDVYKFIYAFSFTHGSDRKKDTKLNNLRNYIFLCDDDKTIKEKRYNNFLLPDSYRFSHSIHTSHWCVVVCDSQTFLCLLMRLGVMVSIRLLIYLFTRFYEVFEFIENFSTRYFKNLFQLNKTSFFVFYYKNWKIMKFLLTISKFIMWGFCRLWLCIILKFIWNRYVSWI